MSTRPTAPANAAPAVVKSTAARLRHWITSGACQTAAGAFAAWFDLTTDRPSFDYPEITGYALTFLAVQSSLSPTEMATGQRAAAWLEDRVRQGKLAARDAWDNNAIYLFDLSMMATGLVSFGRRVRDDRFVRTGLDLVTFIGEELSSERFWPISTRGPRSSRRDWSSEGIPHLAKVVQALLISGRSSDRAHLAELIGTVEGLQQADGRMLTNGDQPVTMLHSHLYAAEGLWVWGSATGDDDSMDHARAAVDWAWRCQLESGGFPRSVADRQNGNANVEQNDVTAQAVRLAVLLDRDSPGVDRAVTRLVEQAYEHRRALAVVYQPDAPVRHLNTWTTIFTAQALAVAIPGAPKITWRQLV